MNIILKPEIERFVEAKLQAGEYSSASEVVNDAIATLMDQDQLTEADIEELRSEVMVGIEEHRRGESIPLDIAAIKAAVKRQGDNALVTSDGCFVGREVLDGHAWYNSKMTDNKWLLYAVLAAVSAAFVGIFAKVGMEGIDSTLATTVRSVVMLIFLICVTSAQELWGNLPKIRGWAIVMIALSGVAGATSWLFGFKALSVGGKVSQVAPIDKLSVPLAAILAFALLKERPSAINWTGIVLITFGAYLAAVPKYPANSGLPTTAVSVDTQHR